MEFRRVLLRASGALPLGSSVYDTGSFSGATAGFTPTIGNVTYTFNAAAAGSGATSSTEGPLGAGSDSFQAIFATDSNYVAATSAVEPLTINKGTVTLSTNIRKAHD